MAWPSSGIILTFNGQGLRKTRFSGWIVSFLQPGTAYIHNRCRFCGNMFGVH